MQSICHLAVHFGMKANIFTLFYRLSFENNQLDRLTIFGAQRGTLVSQIEKLYTVKSVCFYIRYFTVMSKMTKISYKDKAQRIQMLRMHARLLQYQLLDVLAGLKRDYVGTSYFVGGCKNYIRPKQSII